MAGKTDIWMPLYIGDYLAATTHLSAMESGAYLHLLMHQWKNGKLPASEEALRRIARVDSDAWSNAWAMLKTFFDDASGSPVQMRLEAIREECDARKAKSSVKAHKAAEARWSKDAPSNAHAMPQPCPSSSSSSTEQKQKPSRDKREVDSRHTPFKIAVEAYGAHLRVKLPWDGSEAKQLDLLLKSSPDLTLAEFQACLNHRARSPGTPHGERPRLWLPNILKYQQGPLNEFGKTERPGSAEATLGMNHSPEVVADAEQTEEESRQRALEHWRFVRERNPTAYARADAWVKRILDGEQVGI